MKPAQVVKHFRRKNSRNVNTDKTLVFNAQNLYAGIVDRGNNEFFVELYDSDRHFTENKTVFFLRTFKVCLGAFSLLNLLVQKSVGLCKCLVFGGSGSVPVQKDRKTNHNHTYNTD